MITPKQRISNGKNSTTNTFEERYCELQRTIKQKAEAAVIAQKLNGRVSAAEMMQAERGADA